VPAPAFDHLDLMARWFAHHLAGEPNGVMDEPLLTVFTRTAPPYDGARVDGEWRAEPAWPPADATTLGLDLAGLTHERITWDGPQWVGIHAPFWDRGGWGSHPGPGARAALVFDTEPFDEPLEILGTPEVEVTLTVDRPVGLVAARLLLIAPDGNSHLICRGSRNLAFPGDLATPVAVEPDRPMQVRFPLRVTSAVVSPGWRLRLALAGADFPIAWPPGVRFTLTIDPEQSRLLLPLVPRRPSDRTLAIAEPPPPPPAPVDRLETSSSWARDRSEGVARFSRQVASSELQPERDGLVYDNRQRIDVSVTDDDPASVRAHATAELTLRRPGWEVRTTGTVEMTADHAAFHVAIEVTATHDGIEVWSRSWRDDIPRKWA
jgi:hypothetical protein